VRERKLPSTRNNLNAAITSPWHGLGFLNKMNVLINGGSTMPNNYDAKCSPETVILAFLGGAIGGMIAGILLAPKAGEETRRELKGYARKTEEEVIERAKEARAALDEAIERGKHFVDERRADVEAALTAGREAMKEKMDKCCS
jgi:gas vesicle protein